MEPVGGQVLGAPGGVGLTSEGSKLNDRSVPPASQLLAGLDEANLGVAVNVEGPDGTTVLAYLNAAGGRILRTAPSDRVGGPPLLDAIPREVERIQHLRKLGEGRSSEPRVHEAVVFTGDGDPVPVEAATSLGTYEGEPAVYVFFRDASRQRTVRDRAARKGAEVRRLMEKLPVGHMHASPQGEILEANPSMAAILGSSVDEVLDRRLPGTWVSEEHWEELMARVRDHGNVKGLELPLSAAEGPRWVRLAAHGVRDGEGGLVYVEIVAEDVTARRTVEDELREHARRLERSNEEWEEFGYVVSHDLQEPLRMVTSYVQLLEQRYAPELDDQALTYIGYASEGAHRIRELIMRFLEFSRVDVEGGPMHPVDLTQVLDAVLSDLHEEVEDADAAIRREALPRAKGDAPQLEQVFHALLSNALKFGGDRPPQVEVRARREDGMVRVEVADEGIGIDPSHHERIFRMFQVLHARDAFEGYGAGLALARKIVARHGGSIGVESRLGEGATFWFTVPAA